MMCHNGINEGEGAQGRGAAGKHDLGGIYRKVWNRGSTPDKTPIVVELSLGEKRRSDFVKVKVLPTKLHQKRNNHHK
jgi:hypothetical protein